MDYATRRGQSLPAVEKRLAPNLDYTVWCEKMSRMRDRPNRDNDFARFGA
jgi:hypothetical protein